jgi:hypothetical protein
MATRTTAELVGGVIEVDSTISLDPFILAASSLVDQVQQYIEENSIPEYASGLTHDERLELVETWLAAHFYHIRDPQAIREQAGSVGASYPSKVDLGINLTHWGQNAILLDHTGTLRRLGSGNKVARVTWVGKDPCEY